MPESVRNMMNEGWWQRLQRTRLVRYTNTYLKNRYDKAIQTRSRLKLQFLQFFPFIVAATITGVFAYAYSRVFHYAEVFSHTLLAYNRYAIFVVTPVCFLASWWLVWRYAPFARGSGIPQVMASIELSQRGRNPFVDQLLSRKIILVKVISSTIKVIGGGILGREGPTIQVAAAIFKLVHDRLPKWWTSVTASNVILAGGAAGLAAAFNTPLGGIVFAIEELSKHHIRFYKSALFIAVIISGLAAQGLGGGYLYLGQAATNYDGWWIYPGIILVAIVTGYFGSVMCSVILRIMKVMRRRRGSTTELLMVLGGAFFVAFFIFLIGTDAMGSGKHLLDRYLFTTDKQVEWYMPFVRMNGLIATFSSGGAGGIFAASLSTGATFGAFVAHALHLVGDNANVLILVGMAGFLTAVTRTPFTSSIIIFEMTDRHSIIFFLLLGTLIANVVATINSRRSFYDQMKENYLKQVDRTAQE